jgi:iron(III) transport system substrate-binding protein
VEPVLEQFRAATGLEVEARYGTDAELMAALREEGAASPADLYWANTTGALVEADAAGLLAEIPDSLRTRPAAFTPTDGRWVPVTTRFRVLAYNPSRVDSTALPASVLDLPGASALRGRIGWTPTYSSFQDFVTALRAQHGDDSTRAWIEGMKALQPRAYDSNTPMLEALAAGEIDVALTNHYYVLRRLHPAATGTEPPPAATPASELAIHRFAAGDVGNLALVTGAGLLRTATHRNAALRYLAFLLSAPAQAHFAGTVREYPVVGGTPMPPYMLSFDRATALSPAVDFGRMTDLEGTLRLLREADLL